MTQSNPPNDPALVALLEFIKNSRGFDFGGYKLTTLTRRLQKRMGEIGIGNYENYRDYIEVHPDEFERLFDTLLINVTSFMRDAEAWNVIRNEIVPIILAEQSSEEIRLWSVGCASGEEAYTAAIVLAEVMGIDEYCRRVKIYATDVDQEALSQARHATYPEDKLETLTPEQRSTFFEPVDGGYLFRRDMRRKVIFGRHDLMQDAPISKIDLLICRNTLMYFNAETQGKILSRFRFALRNQGFIFLGKAEMLLAHSNVFNTVNLKYRIFRKLPSQDRPERFLIMPSNRSDRRSDRNMSQTQLRDAAFNNSPLARIVVNPARRVMLINQQARELFHLSADSLGQPLQDLEISYRPVELRSRIDEAFEQRRSVMLQGVRWSSQRLGALFLDIQVQPLFDIDAAVMGVSINFTDVTHYKQLRQELENSKQELEVAYEELQSTNEELETTNEELQSSNEELETTNEELQSTNEELETMNEELQSTNEELQTVNDELQERSQALNRSNTFLEAILASLDRGVIVLNREFVIQAWNTQAEELWGLRADETVGRHLLNLDIGLPLEELRQPLRACIAGEMNEASEFTLNAINRRGRRIECRITCTSLMNLIPGEENPEVQGVILMMEDHIIPNGPESSS